jgi:predicted dehydrogenase
MDLMIHDIDATLSLVKSPVTAIDAVGISVLGDHEDMVSARLHFANGAVANLTASRTSYAPARTMQVFTPTCFASIDFAARKSVVVEPRADVLAREFNLEELEDDTRALLRERLFEELLVKRDVAAIESNAIEEELLDFAGAICDGREPRVTGADGRDAVAVAGTILERVQQHQWDGVSGRRVGALAEPMPLTPVVQTAADSWATDETVVLRRKAS